jgi:hypothetical protein
MSLSSNVEYSTLKKRGGTHNWGGVSSRELLDTDLFADDSQELSYEGILHPSALGEAYSLVGLEE